MSHQAEVLVTTTPRSQLAYGALHVFQNIGQKLSQHPFPRSGFYGLSADTVVTWKQGLLKEFHRLATQLDSAGLPGITQKVDKQRERLEKEFDTDVPLDVQVTLLNVDDTPIREARERRFEQFANVATEVHDALQPLREETQRRASEYLHEENDAQRRAEELRHREEEQRQREQMAAEQRERTAADERDRASRELASKIADFEAGAAPNLERGCAAVVSGLYFVGEDGQARNVGMSVVLVPRDYKLSGHEGPRLLDFEGLRGFRGLVPAEQVQPLLDSLRAGRIPEDCLPGVTDAISLSSGWAPNVHEYDAGAAAPLLYQPFAGTAVKLIGRALREESPAEVWGKLPRRLPALDPSFASVAHLASALDLTEEPRYGGTTTQCEVFSPVWLRLRRVDADVIRRKVSVEVESFWTDLEADASISLTPTSPGSKSPPRVPLSAEEWSTENPARPGEPHVFKRTLDVPGGIGPVVVSLNFRGRSIGRVEIGNVSPRLVAHASVDPDFKTLRRQLTEEKNSEGFENGVCLLLHLCGFSAGPYGYKGMDRAPDVIAFLDVDVAVFGECTIEPPDAKKVKNLSSRAGAFRTTLERDHARSINVVATMFVKRPRVGMKPEGVEGALGESVTIAFEEDIQTLLAMALRGESARRVVEFLSNLGRPPSQPENS